MAFIINFLYFSSLGKVKKYIDNKWVELPFEDQLKLTKIEGQVSLFILLLILSTNKYVQYVIHQMNNAGE